MHPESSANNRQGFTLVELLVSTALIASIMVMLLSTVDQTHRVWKRQQTKTAQFQAARSAFEIVARRLSQATLNTYWKAHESDLLVENANFRFRRQSDLQFVSGPTKRFFSKLQNMNVPVDENYPGHALFFTAPIGYTATLDNDKLRKFRMLDSSLAAFGYFVEFGDDPSLPNALRQGNPPYPSQFRYRLMEMTVPTEKFNIHARPVDDQYNIDPRIFDENATTSVASYYEGLVSTSRMPNAAFVRPLWMKEAFQRTIPKGQTTPRFTYAQPLAENILALIVLPKLAVKDRYNPPNSKNADSDFLELAPRYEYDSWRVLSGKTESDPTPERPPIKLDNRARDNLLPPIVQLTMIALDEPSAFRLDLKMTGKPDWFKTLFTTADKESTYLQNMQDFEVSLRNDVRNINYRIFTTDVVIRGSKWSRDPNN